MKKLRSLIISIIILVTAVGVCAQDFGEPTGTWGVYDVFEIQAGAKVANIYAPTQAAEGNPWVMRARWWNVNRELDQALLDRGYHIAYIDPGTYEYGSPSALGMWDALYAEMTETYNFEAKPVLLGGSRGGMQVHNWALANLDKVKSICGVVPVCDFRSWPGRWPESNYWSLVKLYYGFESDEEAYAYQGNVVDAYAPLVDTDIPILHIAGTADESVLFEDNSQLLYDRLTAAGGEMRLEVVQGGTHADTWDKYYQSVNYDLTETVDFLVSEPVPEPATIGLLLVSGIAWMGSRRK